MNAEMTAVAQACLQGAETNSLKFPVIVGRLMEAGFESYEIDFRQGTAAYFDAAGEYITLKAHKPASAIASAFDVMAIKQAIREAQQDVPGYTYRGFCEKVAAAGCARYAVSFSGRRALYIGRTAETHTEHFPK